MADRQALSAFWFNDERSLNVDSLFLDESSPDMTLGFDFALPLGDELPADFYQRMTEIYQQKIRNSPIWDVMVQEHGLERAEQLLKEFRAQPVDSLVVPHETPVDA